MPARKLPTVVMVQSARFKDGSDVIITLFSDRTIDIDGDVGEILWASDLDAFIDALAAIRLRMMGMKKH